MKKVFSIILLFVMILCITTTVNAATYTNTKLEVVDETVCTINLGDMGIFEKKIVNFNADEKSVTLEGRKNDIEEMLKLAQMEDKKDIITEEEVKQILEKDLQDFEKLDIIRKKAIIQKWVKKIRVTDTHVIITLNLLPEQQQLSIGLAPTALSLFHRQLIFKIE